MHLIQFLYLHQLIFVFADFSVLLQNQKREQKHVLKGLFLISQITSFVFNISGLRESCVQTQDQTNEKVIRRHSVVFLVSYSNVIRLYIAHRK